MSSGQPNAAVSLTVTNGLFNVLLGDAGMTALPASVFSGTTRYLRVWFSSDNIAFALLSPDRRIAAVPYALQATNADLLDGQESSAFQQKYDNVVVVAKSGGDYTTIGAALAAISASSTDRYLIWVAPGTYTESVTMEPYVDIQGAGEGVTKITYGGSGTWNLGTVIGADNAELRTLTVENTGGATYAVAIYNGSASPRLTHVTCVAAAGTTTTYGVRNITGSPMMTDVSISVTGSATAIGVYNGTSSAPELTHVTVSTSGANNNYGIWSESSSAPTLQDVTVRAAGGDASNQAVRNQSPVTMLNVVAATAGVATSLNYGVYNTDVVTMTQVTARASGGNNAYGVYNTGAQVVMLDVNATASDATGTNSTNSGIYSTYASTVTMTQVVATVSGAATSNYGIYNAASSSATMRLVTVEATNGIAANEYVYGVYNNTSEFTLDNSQVSANGGDVCYGVFNVAAAGARTVKINNSQISGRSVTVHSNGLFTTYIGASQLSGGNVTLLNGATDICIGVYDENYVSPGYNTCP